MSLEFEWDENKAAANWRDHGVAFHEAIKAFRDVFAVEYIDDREDYGETRTERRASTWSACAAMSSST